MGKGPVKSAADHWVCFMVRTKVSGVAWRVDASGGGETRELRRGGDAGEARELDRKRERQEAEMTFRVDAMPSRIVFRYPKVVDED